MFPTASVAPPALKKVELLVTRPGLPETMKLPALFRIGPLIAPPATQRFWAR